MDHLRSKSTGSGVDSRRAKDDFDLGSKATEYSYIKPSPLKKAPPLAATDVELGNSGSILPPYSYGSESQKNDDNEEEQ
jgi:hypothetical protein